MAISVMIKRQYPENLIYDIVGEEDIFKEILKTIPHEDLESAIEEMLKTIPLKNSVILKLKYKEIRKNKEIGEVFGISKKRVIQIRNKSLKLLRAPDSLRKLYRQRILIKDREKHLNPEFRTFLYNLDLPTKTYNILKRAKFINKEDFEGKNISDFCHIRGIGPKCYTEIKQRLDEKGIKINEEV